jgi:23S rRNA (uracil1939-C5)-methyltransferase
MNTLILKVDRPAHRGLFIGRHDGKVVMISGATMPGETVEVTVEDDKKDYLTASVTKIVEPSPDRVEPPCKYFGICGGCRYQHIPYELQVKIKEDILKDSMRRLAGTETELAKPIMRNIPWHYRLRAQFSVSPGGVGFHKRGTNEVVNIDKCMIMNREINDVIPKVNDVISQYRIKELHITGSDSLIAKVITRKKALSPSDAEQLASGLLGCGISGMNIFIGDDKPLTFGNAFLTLNLLNLNYTILPPSFVQCNWNVNIDVAEFLRNHLRPLQGKRILDLFAGAGNFSLPLADNAEVTAVEGNANAIESGRRNVQVNNIENYHLVASPAEKFSSNEHFDIMILDPPRPGLRKKLIKKVLSMMPEKIVYISCNPATFARDLRKLSEKYELESVRMIDFFPQTFHIESLAFLSLK